MNNNMRWIFSVLFSAAIFFGCVRLYVTYHEWINPFALTAMGMFSSYILIGESARLIYNRIKQPESPVNVPVKND